MKYIRLIFLCIILVLAILCNQNTIEYKYVINTDYFTSNDIETNEAIYAFNGTITAYGPDCEGCIGITASGYNVKNTIYYDDTEYGKVRIIAADKNIPFGTIVKISNLKKYDNIIAIVLDRGGVIGYNKSAQVDLLYSDETSSYEFGRIFNVNFEILRLGY